MRGRTRVWFRDLSEYIPSTMKNALPDAVAQECDVTARSAFKTPAKTAYFFEVLSKDDLPVLSEAVSRIRSKGLPVAFLGDGTNCLFAFDRFPGLLVKNSLSWFRKLESAESGGEVGEEEISAPSRFEVGSAERVHSVALLMATEGNPWLVPWIGLPGTFWWAVVWNAGCFWLETADVLETAEVWNMAESRLETLSVSDMGFAYRTSVLKNSTDRFMVSSVFDLSKRKPWNAYESVWITEFREIRRSKQPAWRTCGSFFKNPEWHSAWALIDKAWLKGKKIWGAEISPMHANFFMASQGADWRDVIALRNLAKTEVLSKFGIELVEEARIVTENG